MSSLLQIYNNFEQLPDDPPYIDVTNIDFNEKMKPFIKKVQSVFLHKIRLLNSYDYYIGIIDNYETLQLEIRTYLINNQSQIDFLKKIPLVEGYPKSYQDFYALFVAIISDIDLCNSFNDCYKQLDKDFMEEMATTCDLAKGYFQNSICLCSHWCTSPNLYLLKNKKTKLMCMVGCDCVQKIDIIDINVFKKAIEKSKNSDYVVSKKKYQKKQNEKKHAFKNKQKITTLKNVFNAWKSQTTRHSCKGCNTLIDKSLSICDNCIIRRELNIKRDEENRIKQEEYEKEQQRINEENRIKLEEQEKERQRINEENRIKQESLPNLCEDCEKVIDVKYNKCFLCNKKSLNSLTLHKCVDCDKMIDIKYSRCFTCNNKKYNK
jgi:hypothetical protein